MGNARAGKRGDGVNRKRRAAAKASAGKRAATRARNKVQEVLNIQLLKQLSDKGYHTEINVESQKWLGCTTESLKEVPYDLLMDYIYQAVSHLRENKPYPEPAHYRQLWHEALVWAHRPGPGATNQRIAVTLMCKCVDIAILHYLKSYW